MEAPSPPSANKSIAGTPKSCCSFELDRSDGGDFTAWFEIEEHESLRELQQMVNRYNDCFRLLKGVLTAIEILREENLQLAAENIELEFAVEEMERGKSAVIGIKNGSDFDSPGGSGSGSGSGCGSEVLSGSGSGSGSGSDRAKRGVGAPKSISIRSRGYLAANNQPTPGGTHRLRLPASPSLQGGKNEEGEVEVEVYNQGTVKTELCNKWAESGQCPYNDRCRFAHGIEELKPVIRHPRYKTQLCRMMGSGNSCPYGHRCHFRHALPTPTPTPAAPNHRNRGNHSLGPNS